MASARSAAMDAALTCTVLLVIYKFDGMGDSGKSRLQDAATVICAPLPTPIEAASATQTPSSLPTIALSPQPTMTHAHGAQSTAAAAVVVVARGDCAWASAHVCSAEELRPGPVSIAYHKSPDFVLVAFGADDFVSQVSLKNDEPYFEQFASDNFIRQLQAARRERARNDTANASARESCLNDPVWLMDIGANIGLHSLSAAAAGFPVLSDEAAHSTYTRLACSAATNGFAHMRAVRAAVGASHGGSVCIASAHSGNVGGEAVRNGGAEASSCPLAREAVRQILSADAVLELEAELGRELPPPTVLKIDCEGCEYNAVAGLRPLWNRTGWRPRIISVESFSHYLRAHSRINGVAAAIDTQALLQFFLPLGYSVWPCDLTRDLTHLVRPGSPDLKSGAELDKLAGDFCNTWVLYHGAPPVGTADWTATRCM